MADHPQGDQPSSTKGIERKIVEKIRRNHMKNLCSQLNSLLPNNNNPRVEALSRVEQIDGAINYIRNLETRVKMAQKHRESLRERKRSRTCSSKAKVEVHEMGSLLRIILVCGFDNQFTLSEIIRILQEDNIEVKTVHSSLSSENKMLHVVNAETQQSFHPGATLMSERLKRIVNGHGETEKAIDFPVWM